MFDLAFERVVLHEGGFQNDPHDRGNWTTGKIGQGELKGTKYGISSMTYPHLDIENLTEEQVRAIYFEDWWQALGMERFRPAMQYQLFDAAVQHGWHRAVKTLQQAVGAKEDGIIGPKTLGLVRNTELNDLLMQFISARIDYYTSLDTFMMYGKGWMRRIAAVLRIAALDNDQE